jgi:dTDP-4-amino-4,6-dideoxygalactose transaminase
MQLIRNHAESVVHDKEVDDISNMIGFNFRMTEIEAAIGREQLKKLENVVVTRQSIAGRLSEGLAHLKGLKLPVIMQESTHVYYVYPMVLDTISLGVPRSRILEALEAEGITGLAAGYVNVHMLPMYQRKTAYGTNGFPWKSEFCHRAVEYHREFAL